jgi:hypothetical protein
MFFPGICQILRDLERLHPRRQDMHCDRYAIEGAEQKGLANLWSRRKIPNSEKKRPTPVAGMIPN